MLLRGRGFCLGRDKGEGWNMTTSKSPLRKLKAQADNMASVLKAASRGEKVASDPAGKIAASIAKGEIAFGVVMDDKIVKITMTWATIRETDEAGISAWIVEYMRGTTPAVQH